jgi:hypothetical protein
MIVDAIAGAGSRLRETSVAGAELRAHRAWHARRYPSGSANARELSNWIAMLMNNVPKRCLCMFDSRFVITATNA